jgi:hypothetical protein
VHRYRVVGYDDILDEFPDAAYYRKKIWWHSLDQYIDRRERKERNKRKDKGKG